MKLKYKQQSIKKLNSLDNLCFDIISEGKIIDLETFIKSVQIVERNLNYFIDLNLVYDKKIFCAISFANFISFYKFVDISFPESRTCRWYREVDMQYDIKIDRIEYNSNRNIISVVYKIL
jgi:hypothetical protein